MDRIYFRIKRMDLETGEFEGLASVYGVADRHGDIVEKGAFTKTIQEKGGQVPLLWQHHPSDVIGIAELFDTDEALTVKGKLNLQVHQAQEALALLKQKAINGLSIGFTTVKEAFEGGLRLLKEISLWEVSVVTFPANEEALVTDVKNIIPFQNLPLASREHAWDRTEARDRVKSWACFDDGLATSTIQKKFSKCFVWCDKEGPNVVASYQLPIADIIDGRLTAVPRAIFAAAASVQGARGGVDIPSADMQKVKAHLGRYFKKMDLTAPWEVSKGFENDLISVMGHAQHLSEKEELKELSVELLDEAIQSLTSLRELRVKSVEPGNHSKDGAGDKGADIGDDESWRKMVKEMMDYQKELSNGCK